MSISTHVLDAVTGRPAAGLGVVLSRRAGGGWRELERAVTDGDGRIAAFGPRRPGGAGHPSGTYRLTFDTDAYLNGSTFYPEVVIVFRVSEPSAHHHVPLLLSPFAYSTYRGS